jgi:hypothetical protein
MVHEILWGFISQHFEPPHRKSPVKNLTAQLNTSTQMKGSALSKIPLFSNALNILHATAA